MAHAFAITTHAPATIAHTMAATIMARSSWDRPAGRCVCMYMTTITHFLYFVNSRFRQPDYMSKYSSGFFFTPFTRTSKCVWMPVLPYTRPVLPILATSWPRDTLSPSFT